VTHNRETSNCMRGYWLNWLKEICLFIQKAEIRKISVRSQPRKTACETLSWKNPLQKWAGGVVQGVSPQFKPQCHKRNLSLIKFLDNRVEIIVVYDFVIFLIDSFENLQKILHYFIWAINTFCVPIKISNSYTFIYFCMTPVYKDVS
jgi:hypothetical protein